MDVFYYKNYSKYKCNHNINLFLIYQNQFSELNIISIRDSVRIFTAIRQSIYL